jgi:hypothetical protein
MAVELMKTADAVATASGSRRWATMIPSTANTPHTPPMRMPGEHASGTAGQGEAQVRADTAGSTEDHQGHHAGPAGGEHGHRHEDQLYQGLDADDRAADRGRHRGAGSLIVCLSSCGRAAPRLTAGQRSRWSETLGRSGSSLS